MSTQTENSTGFKSFQATGTAIAIGKRVTVNSSGLIAVADHDVGAIGVTLEPVAANGVGTVKLFNAAGTFLMYANAAITAGAQLYPTDGGGVDDSGTTALPLVAFEAATAQGDIIECGRFLLGA